MFSEGRKKRLSYNKGGIYLRLQERGYYIEKRDGGMGRGEKRLYRLLDLRGAVPDIYYTIATIGYDPDAASRSNQNLLILFE